MAPTAFVGKCPCGQVSVTLTPREDQELKSFLCHCYSCRRHSMAPVVMEVLVKGPAPETGFKLEGTTGDDVRTLPTHTTVRMHCAVCHSAVAVRWKMGDATEWGWGFPVMLFELEEGKGLPDGFPKPDSHCWYNNRVMDIKDGLPKWATWQGFSDQVDESTGKASA